MSYISSKVSYTSAARYSIVSSDVLSSFTRETVPLQPDIYFFKMVDVRVVVCVCVHAQSVYRPGNSGKSRRVRFRSQESRKSPVVYYLVPGN